MSLPGVNRRHLAAGAPLPPLKKDTLRLYGMKFCPWAQRTVLACSAKNISVDIVNVHLKRKPDWFLEKNPLGKVPTLELNDKIVYDSSICNEWLDSVFPEHPILPSDPYERAHQKMIVEKLSVFGPIYGAIRSGGDEASLKTLESTLKVHEDHLASQNYFSGASCGYADYVLWPFFERLDVAQSQEMLPQPVVTPEKFPKLAAYIERMKQRSEVKATIQDYKIHAEFLRSAIKGEPPQYDVGKVEDY